MAASMATNIILCGSSLTFNVLFTKSKRYLKLSDGICNGTGEKYNEIYNMLISWCALINFQQARP